MKLVIRNARLSFPDLYTAVQYQNQGPFNYRATFLVPADGKMKKEIAAAIRQVAADKFGAKADAILKEAVAKGKICFLDGSEKDYNGYDGQFYLVATRQDTAGAPVVVDRAKQRLAESSGQIYSGCYVNAVVEIWAQSNTFGKTVRCTLVSVQKIADGESFGGAAPATDEGLDDLGFDESADDFYGDDIPF
jgi:hypothetical protein